MADIIVDGKTRVFAIPYTGQDLTALSAAAINLGEALHEVLVPTGLEGFEGSTAEIDTTPLGSAYDTKLAGRTSFSGTNLLAKMQSGTDPVFDMLSVKGTALVIVILDGVDADVDVVATDEYEAYPVTTGEYNYVGRGEANSLLRYRVPVPVSRPRVRGTAAA
jgi:hypothetical protein